MDYRGWSPIMLGKIEKKRKTYTVKRMVPPGPVYFFYSFKFKECANNTRKLVSSHMFKPI